MSSRSRLPLVLPLLLGALLLGSCSPRLRAPRLSYRELPSRFGDPAYDILGVSAAAAGRLGGQLFFAGGANFPERPAAEGGAKRLYRQAFLGELHGTELRWRPTTALPRPLAYGLSLQTADTLFLLGGQSPEGPRREVYALTLEGGEVRYRELAPLPFTLDNAAGAAAGSYLYIVGGNQDGRPSRAVWRYDRSAPERGWQRLADLPDPEGYVQPVATMQGDTLWVGGGFTPGSPTRPARVQQGLYRLITSRPELGWRGYYRSAPANEHSGGLLFPWGGALVRAGGVDREVFSAALERIRLLALPSSGLSPEERTRIETEQASYLRHPKEWYRFERSLSFFDPKAGRWLPSRVSDERFARAGATLLVYSPECVLVMQGEQMPGIRTPQIICLEAKP